MTNDKSIFIRNIYYMLSYAFQVLRQENYDEIASEEFGKVQDLLTAILVKGVSQQLKQGLHREYVTKNENIPTLRGKLDVTGSIKNQIQSKQLLSCQYDELTEDNIYNQILKTTMMALVRERTIKSEYRTGLKKVMLYFDGIDTVNPVGIRWDMLHFQRNNRTYEMLMNLCFFILNGMLLTTEKGSYKMETFSDNHMARLYEKFVLEYYKRHHTYLTEVKAAQVKWNLGEDADENMIRFLPVMQTDIFLRLNDLELIIDTKYYGRVMQKRYDSYSLHSNNLYQIFTYVKNQDRAKTGKVSGMLLYAKTDEAIAPDCEFPMSGNRISVKTLDLNLNFSLIARQLDAIAESHFGKLPKDSMD